MDCTIIKLTGIAHKEYIRKLRKHAYSNILKILLPETYNFQTKNSDLFHIYAQKHRLWYSLELDEAVLTGTDNLCF